MRRHFLILLVTVLFVLPAARAEGPTFLLRTSAGKEYRGPIAKLFDGAIEIGSGVRRRWGSHEWLSLRHAETTLPEYPTEEHLILANGDRLPVQDFRIQDEKAYLRHKDLASDKPVSLSLAGIALIWRLPPDGTVSPMLVRRQLLETRRSRDLVLLRNGDTLEGTVHSLDGGKLAIDTGKKTVSARWAQVSAIAFSTDLLDRLRPKGRYTKVILHAGASSPGGRFTLTSTRGDGDKLEGTTAFGAAFQAPWSRIAGVQMRGEGIQPLSEMVPRKYDYLPYLDEKWPWKIDTTVTGRDLRLGGSTYDQGISVRASSRLVYSLDRKFRRFDTTVGLDDHDGKRGNVQLQILVDGKRIDLGPAHSLSQAHGPQHVSIVVAGASELTLEVRTSEQNPIQGVVDFAEPVLLE